MTKTGSGFVDPVEQVLSGRLTEVPAPPSNAVTIYVASTGEDWALEREQLWEAVLPDLQHQLVPHGIDVQFVDYHHEAYVGHAYDRRLFDLHLQHIATCHRRSMGPFFLCLLGDKHGLVPLPAYLEEAEYAMVKQEADCKDAALLDTWYIKQSSAPPVHVLAPLHTHYPSARQRGHLSQEELAEWKATFEKLQELIQHAAAVSLKKGRVDKAESHKQQRFFMSSVEQEIQEALQLSLSNCLVIQRRFTPGISGSEGAAHAYTDHRANGSVNTEAQERLATLKQILTSKLTSDRVLAFTLPWHQQGLNPEAYTAHAGYLENFHTEVVHQIITMVESHMSNHPEFKSNHVTTINKRDLYREVRGHVTLQQRLLTRMYGFEEAEQHFKRLLVAGYKERHQGVLVHGGDGSGKQALATRLCAIAQEVLGKDCLVLVRYIGATAECRTVHGLLLSACAQLQHLLQAPAHSLRHLDTPQLLSHFHAALNHVAKASFRSTVLVIDGLHRIKPSFSTSKVELEWLAAELPPKVHLVMTMSDAPHYSACFTAFRDMFLQGDNVLHIPVIEPKHVKGISRDFANSEDRNLNPEQEKLILDICKKEPSPLLVQFVTDIVMTEPKILEHQSEAMTLTRCIQKLFDFLEQLYDPALVTQFCHYVSAAHMGLSEMELLDILSCNNSLILAVNKSIIGTQAVQGSQLRFPAWLLHALLHDMRLLLTTYFINGKHLITWSHKVVAKQAIQRYKPSTEEIKRTHSDIADLFLEKWLGNKPLIAPERGLALIDTACRYVSPQPLLYSDTKYNYRRLSETWFQLLHTGDIGAFKEQTLCNFEYLLGTLHSASLTALTYQLDMTVGHVMDVDLYLVQRCITLAKAVLRRDPIQLASELIGRLRHLKENSPIHIESLVQQCMEWCDAHMFPLVVPLSSWQPDPRSELVATLTLPQEVTYMCATPNGQHVFCSEKGSNDIHMYHVASRRRINTLKGQKAGICCMAVTNDNRFLLSSSGDGLVYVWTTTDGRLHHVFREHKDKVECMIQFRHGNEVITGCRDKRFRVLQAESKQVTHCQEAHDGPVTCMALSKGGAMLATGSTDGKIHVWCLDEMSLLNTIEGGVTSPIISLALTQDNTFLITGFEDGSVLVKAFTTGTDGHKLDSHPGKATSIIASRDSHHCLINSSDGNIYTYNFRTRTVLHTYRCRLETPAPTSACHLTRDENLIFSAAGNTVHLWTFFKEMTTALAHDDHKDIVTCIATSRDGKMGISGSRDTNVKLWNLEISDLVATWRGHEAQVTCVDIAEHEAFAVTGSEDTTVKVWSIIMGCVITDYKGHRSTVMHVVAMVHSLDNFQVLSAEEDGSVHVWQAQDGEPLLTCESSAALLAVTPSMKYAISGPGDTDLQLWRVEDGTLVGAEIHHVDSITCVEFSPDSTYIVTGSADCSLKVWETCTAKLTQVLVEHTQAVTCGVVAEGNRHVVSGSHDQRVLVWGLETGAVEHYLTGHTERITCLRVTRDASLAISGSRDGTLRVWNILLGQPVTTFALHMPVHNMHMTPTATRMLVQLERHPQLPVLCLHNSPAGHEFSRACVIEVTEAESAGEEEEEGSETTILPIKPKSMILRRPNKVFVATRNINPPSVSSIPEIIKLSPMKAPLQQTMRAQEEHKEKRSLVRGDFSSHGSGYSRRRKEAAKASRSNVCALL